MKRPKINHVTSLVILLVVVLAFSQIISKLDATDYAYLGINVGNVQYPINSQYGYDALKVHTPSFAITINSIGIWDGLTSGLVKGAIYNSTGTYPNAYVEGSSTGEISSAQWTWAHADNLTAELDADTDYWIVTQQGTAGSNTRYRPSSNEWGMTIAYKSGDASGYAAFPQATIASWGGTASEARCYYARYTISGGETVTVTSTLTTNGSVTVTTYTTVINTENTTFTTNITNTTWETTGTTNVTMTDTAYVTNTTVLTVTSANTTITQTSKVITGDTSAISSATNMLYIVVGLVVFTAVIILLVKRRGGL